jgi:hypothetical protein
LEEIIILFICTRHQETIDEINDWVVIVVGQELMKSSLM